MKSRQSRGYNLIELSIALVVLGLITILIWRFGSLAMQRIVETEAPQTLEEANQALIGFAMANHRLPCPDTSAIADGQEHCGGAVIGRLPWVTLGMARADMQNIRYGVYRNTVSTSVNGAAANVRVDLDFASDRFPPLVAHSATQPMGVSNFTGTTVGLSPINMAYTYGSASASETYLNISNGIDFCHALRLAGRTDATTSLNIPNVSGKSYKNVAYALALPGAKDMSGDGNPFDGANTAALTFSAPGQPVSSNYDDFVMASDFGQLFDSLSCGGTLSAAEHAQFNAATAAALMHANFVNYNSQLILTAELAYANWLMAIAAVSHAAGDVVEAGGALTLGVADSLLGNEAGLPLAGLALGASIAGTVLAAVADALAADSLTGSLQTIDDFKPFLEESTALETSTYEDAKAADAAGLY